MPCLTDHDLISLLSSEAESPEWSEHLSHCDKCQQLLEDATRDASFDARVRETDPLDEQVAHLIATLQHSDTSVGDSTLQQLSDLVSFVREDPPQIEGFKIEGPLGQGGMGVVWSAIQMDLGRRVAIKMLAPELVGQQRAIDRFIKEARAVASIEHEHVIAIHCVGQSKGVPYFVMRQIEGQSLDAQLAGRKPLNIAEATKLATQMASALSAAHDLGITHRDIKPGNILVEAATGNAVLCDFGLAHMTSEVALTRTGTTMGTPQYMSPEQVTSAKVDQRSDLFSLGCVLYHGLTGKAPFRGDNAYSVAHDIVSKQVSELEPLPDETPDRMKAIIARLLEKNPDHRFQSAAKLLDALRGKQTEKKRLDSSTSHLHSNFYRWIGIGILMTIACVVLASVRIDTLANPTVKKIYPTEAPTVAPLVSLTSAQGNKQDFGSLQEVINAAFEGATIELSAAETHIIEKPLALSNRHLSIRAADGTRPVLRFPPVDIRPVLSIENELFLEGLDIELPTSTSSRSGKNSIVVGDSSQLNMRRCRLIGLDMGTRHAMIMAQGSAVCEMDDCLLTTHRDSFAFRIEAGGEVSLSLENCLLAVGTVVATLGGNGSLQASDVNFTNTTIHAGAIAHLLVGDTANLQNPLLNVTASGNVFDVQHVLVFAGGMRHRVAYANIPNAVAWAGDSNIYSVTGSRNTEGTKPGLPLRIPYCGVIAGRNGFGPLRIGPRGLREWSDIYASEDRTSREIIVKFQRELETTRLESDRSQPDDFRWRPATELGRKNLPIGQRNSFGANLEYFES